MEDLELEYALALVELSATALRTHVFLEQLELQGTRLAQRLTPGQKFRSAKERQKAALAKALARVRAVAERS